MITMNTRNIGADVKAPEKTCTDKKCPFHGDISVRGRKFVGIVVGKDLHRSATVEWDRFIAMPKYERLAKRRSKVRVHNPACIDAQKGDKVTIMECRPLSKTKSLVIIENLGKQFGFEQMEEARLESKHKDKESKKSDKEDADDQSADKESA